MSATLYQLTNQMAEIEAMLEETGGEITPELEAVWNETSESLPQKVDGYNQVLRNLTAYAANLADEIKRLQGLKKTADNSAKRIKEHVLDCMETFGIQKLEGNYCKMSLRSSTQTEVDEDSVLLPYLSRVEKLGLPSWITCELKINKTALKEAFKGKDVTPGGVRFVEKNNLIIK